MGGKPRKSIALRTYSDVKGPVGFMELLRSCRFFESAITPRLNIKDLIYFSMFGDGKKDLRNTISLPDVTVCIREV